MATVRCPTCGGSENIVGKQYALTSEDYDGVSEWQCPCGVRWGRWSGRILQADDIERRYGRAAKENRGAPEDHP